MGLGTNVGVGEGERNEHTWLGFLILEETRLVAVVKVHQESRIPCGLRSAIYRRSAKEKKRKTMAASTVFIFYYFSSGLPFSTGLPL